MDEPVLSYMFFALAAILAAIFVLCVIAPNKAVLYDEDRQELIFRGGFNILVAFKTKRAHLSEIEFAVGTPMNIIMSGNLWVKTRYWSKKFYTYRKPEFIANKINWILYEYRQGENQKYYNDPQGYYNPQGAYNQNYPGNPGQSG